MTTGERRALTAVARGEAAADLYIRGGTLLNVYTGELYAANLAALGERIAYVGLREDMIGARTRVIDARGRVLSPGYVEPHAHPEPFVTPSALARAILPLGTTTMFADTLPALQLGGLRGFRAMADALADLPLKYYWMVRVLPQARLRDEPRAFPLRDVARALGHPRAVAAGEVTRWPEIHRGDREVLRRLHLALSHGRRVEGHTAGASAEKIPAIVAGGVSSDHEPTTADEVLDRARQGLAVMLRESSLRRDLSGLLDALKRAPGLASRAMLTTDGSMPAYVRAHGFSDHVLRIALDGGVPAPEAYRMVTLNPATYYGLDRDLGGLAPGRYADVCVLADLAEPRPELVIARGRLVAERGRLLARVPEIAWQDVFTSPEARLAVRWRARAADFELPRRTTYPVIRLVSAVITALEERPLAAGDLRAALVDRAGRWVAPAVVTGLADGLEAMATTLSTDFNILVLGRSPEAMALAVNRLLDLRGGVVIVEGGRVAWDVALPIAGLMRRGTLAEAADAEVRLHEELAALGYAYHDPIFTLFFLSADFLPAVRLSPRGVWDVRRGRVILPARRR